ncbi:MAG TPA: hypothetical protein VGN25_00660 [Solirubrobacteraceae bacterium]|jgi:hypothetical protein|nr:hypothetical protein [Solirubrobacteraceae bacterium]
MPTQLIKHGPLACAAALIALTISADLPACVQAQGSAAITPLLSPNRLGAKGAFTLGLQTSGEFGLQSPMRRAIVKLPPGLNLYIPTLRSCSAARLRARGPSGCPAQSRLGSGQGLVESRAGSQLVSEHIDLSVFIGPPQNLAPTFLVLGEGFTPLQERIVLSGSVAESHAPYGEELVMNIPPIATLPLEPDATLVSLTLTVGANTRPVARSANAVVMPSRCPTGGFPFAAEFTFADGSSTSATAPAHCPATKSTD